MSFIIHSLHQSVREQALNLASRNAEKVDKLAKDRERAKESTAPCKVQSSCCIKLRATAQLRKKKKMGEMKECVKRQSAARLLNINSFIYM